MILNEIRTARPNGNFASLVRLDGMIPRLRFPRQVFARDDAKTEIYLDSKTDAHLGAFVLGEGSLKDWQELVAKPSRKSSRLRLSIAAALAAPFLRLLGLDSFGINWFSDTSDGKTLCLIVAASVAGLMGLPVCHLGRQ